MFHLMLRNGWPYIAQRLGGHRFGDATAQRRRGLAGALLLLICMLVMSACAPVQPVQPVASFKPTASYDATVPSAWFDLSLKLVKETPGFSPPVAARAFGYLGVTLYETVRPGMSGYRSLAGQLNGLTDLPTFSAEGEIHWPTAANAALASMTRKLFVTATPENQAAIEELAAGLEAQANLDPATLARSVAWGEAVAEAIYAWSLEDGGHEGYATSFDPNYVPPVGDGLWVSTPPGYLQALQPHWGENRPFVLSAGDECPAPPPPAYSEEVGSDFYADAFEVYDTVRNLSAEQEAIALFWADDPGKTATPPGHWISILTQVLAQEQATLEMAAEGYAKVGIAVADAFITCWHTKYVYNLVRPITYIQAVIDPNWNTPNITDPVITPPFPEYTSGHSVQSGAAAAVLTDLFGEDYAFVDHTHDVLGHAPRSFKSFTEAAEEAAISRLYGGIHYRSAIEQGLLQGQCVGAKVNQLQFRETGRSIVGAP